MTPSGVSFLIGLCPLISWDSTPICIKCFHALKLNPHQRTEQTLLSRLPQEEIMQRSCIIYQHRAYSNPGLTDTKIYSTILLLTICTESSAVPPITCLPPPDGPCTTIPSANKIYLVHSRKLHVNGSLGPLLPQPHLMMPGPVQTPSDLHLFSDLPTLYRVPLRLTQCLL